MNIITENYQLYNGDCLEVMDRLIEEGVVVDAIICDPPYGTTACKWDTVIPFEDMWSRLNKLIKPNGAIILFGSQPFTSELVLSNKEWFSHSWIWEKEQGTNFLLNMFFNQTFKAFYLGKPNGFFYYLLVIPLIGVAIFFSLAIILYLPLE